ncbi:MAG: sulfatase-like hydrolase/transferase, partial [Bacteroidales bacterium]|nr:sulfatase-like hydrolase/transferase [Bacteroidales bacterium]
MKRTDLCRRLPSLAQSLRDQGYSTAFSYGGDIDFTNMRLYFLEAGFDNVRGSEAFPSSWYTSAWGVPDHLMLSASNLVPQRRPFFSAVLTLSSHEPWDVPMHRLVDTRCNAFAYTDSCIGAFVDSLRRT